MNSFEDKQQNLRQRKIQMKILKDLQNFIEKCYKLLQDVRFPM